MYCKLEINLNKFLKVCSKHKFKFKIMNETLIEENFITKY